MSGLKRGLIQDVLNSQASDTESVSNSQEEEEDIVNTVMANVKYSHGALARPYGPPSF